MSMLTIRRQKRAIHQTVRQHLLKRIRARSKIHLLHLLLLVVLPNPQMVRQATRRMPQQGLLSAIPLMTEPKRRLRLILLRHLLKMPRTILRLRRINRRRRPMCRSPRRRLAAVTLRPGHQGDQRQDLHPDRQRAAAACDWFRQEGYWPYQQGHADLHRARTLWLPLGRWRVVH